MEINLTNLALVEALQEGQSCYINMFQDGGSLVTREEGKLCLQPMFGGDPGRPFYFSLDEASKLVEKAQSWC